MDTKVAMTKMAPAKYNAFLVFIVFSCVTFYFLDSTNSTEMGRS